jgi:hypothetical protein
VVVWHQIQKCGTNLFFFFANTNNGVSITKKISKKGGHRVKKTRQTRRSPYPKNA